MTVPSLETQKAAHSGEGMRGPRQNVRTEYQRGLVGGRLLPQGAGTIPVAVHGARWPARADTAVLAKFFSA